MAITYTPRFNLYRWSDDEDEWDREQFDSDNARIDQLGAIAIQSIASVRPAPGVERRFHLAVDTKAVSLDTGVEWLTLLTANAPATSIAFTPTGSITSTTVQAAIAELDTDLSGKVSTAALTAHTGATAGAHAATAISVTPSGTIAATTVQAALVELDTEKHPKMTAQGSYTLVGSGDRSLAAYTANAQGTPYTGGPADLTGAAKVDDLNALRVAVENQRVYTEDLAGLLIAAVTDLRNLGLLG